MIFACCLAIGACSATDKEFNPTAENLYNRGYKELEKTAYSKAAFNFSKAFFSIRET